jgi:hypothetical protein
MKSPEEIKRLGSQWALDNADRTMETNSALNRGFIGGYTECQKYMANEIRMWRGAVETQAKRCEALRELAQERYTQEQLNNAIKFAITKARFNYNSQEKDLWQYNQDQIIQAVNEQLAMKTPEEIKYSKTPFEGHTHRFIVEFEVGQPYTSNLHIYSNSDSYQKLDDFIKEKKSDKVISYKIIHRASKEQDEMASKFIDEIFNEL